jgi:hypothetical protein
VINGGVMAFLLTFLRFHKQWLLAVSILLGCVLLLALLIGSFGTGTFGFTLLGDVNAARPAALPASGSALAPPQVRPADSVRQAAPVARDTTADLQPSARYQEPLLAALNCAREQAGQAALTHDPQLSRAAAEMWRELVRHPSTTLATIAAGRYTQVTILPLTLAEPPAPPDALAQDVMLEQPQGPCVWGGIDITQVDLTGRTSVGVAVFPDPHPEDGLDDSSAVVVAQ